MKNASSLIWIGALLLAVGCDIDLGAKPDDTSGADDGSDDACRDLPAQITQDELLEHLEAFEEIATKNGNRRSVGTRGYAESVSYVQDRLEHWGFDVKTREVYAVVAGEMVETSSLIAETSEGDPDDVLMLGAHLDSVPTGPGINDNVTSVAALLEVAWAIHDCPTKRRVRFAFWGAEEAMLAGSEAYVDSLDDDERDAIAGYLNFEMLGSPNYARFVYDGDASAFDEPVAHGSAAIEEAFLDYFDEENLETVPMGYAGRSDHVPFAEAGIAIGGIFTGAEMVKTEDEANEFGGKAGEPYDACYHEACDDIDNVDLEVFEQMTSAIAYAVEELAM